MEEFRNLIAIGVIGAVILVIGIILRLGQGASKRVLLIGTRSGGSH